MQYTGRTVWSCPAQPLQRILLHTFGKAPPPTGRLLLMGMYKEA